MSEPTTAAVAAALSRVREGDQPSDESWYASEAHDLIDNLNAHGWIIERAEARATAEAEVGRLQRARLQAFEARATAEALLERLVAINPYDYEEHKCLWCGGGWERVKTFWKPVDGAHKEGCAFDEARNLIKTWGLDG